MTVNRENCEVVTVDGWRLTASVVSTPAPARAVLIVNSAMAVPHKIYLPLAGFLARNGIATLLYDYRGIAGSAPKSLRACTADLLDWARYDYPAAIAAARNAFPHVPLVVLGHSVGGQIIGLDRVSCSATACIAVAAQSGYWGHWDGTARAGMWSLWHLVIPSLAPLLGYLPARALGLGENLPHNVALQWAAWGRHPLYLRNPDSGPKDQSFEAIESPLLSIGIEDDAFAPPRAIEAFRGWFTRAQITRVTVAGTERLGHFGWFREEKSAGHWRAMLEWLEPTLTRPPLHPSHSD